MTLGVNKAPRAKSYPRLSWVRIPTDYIAGPFPEPGAWTHGFFDEGRLVVTPAGWLAQHARLSTRMARPCTGIREWLADAMDRPYDSRCLPRIGNNGYLNLWEQNRIRSCSPGVYWQIGEDWGERLASGVDLVWKVQPAGNMFLRNKGGTPAPAPAEPRVDVGRTSILISPASRYPLSFALQNWPSPRPGLPKG